MHAKIETGVLKRKPNNEKDKKTRNENANSSSHSEMKLYYSIYDLF